MSDEGGMFFAGVFVTFACCMLLNDCDRTHQVQRFADQACELSCQRNHAGKAHTADETFCTCTNGTALKRDRSRLYVPVGGKP